MPERLLERAETVFGERNGRVLALFRLHQLYVIELGEAVVHAAVSTQSISLSKQVHNSVIASFVEGINVRLAHHVLAQILFKEAIINRLLYNWIIVLLAP